MSFRLPQKTETDFELPPAGLYKMTLKEMENGIAGDPQYGGGERVKWIFTIDDVISGDEESDEFIGEEYWAWSSFKMSPKSNMYQWVSALWGRSIEADDEISNDDLIGKSVHVNLVDYVKQTGVPGIKIGSMTPVPRRKKRSKPAPPSEDDDLEDEWE